MKKFKLKKKIYSKFFSQDLVDKIIKDKNLGELGGINTFASILFFDIRDSTPLAESLDPKTFAAFLNLLYADISVIISQNFGSINKFLGDGLLITFGCPVVYNNDVFNCVRTALEIEKLIKLFNLDKPPYLKKDIAVGMGIASGKVFAGNIGSNERMEYTVLGDPVNIASRLESLTKNVDQNIVIDKTTRDALGDALFVEKLDFSYVRGHIGKLDLYGLKAIDLEKAKSQFQDDTALNNIDDIGEVEFF